MPTVLERLAARFQPGYEGGSPKSPRHQHD